MKNLSKILSVFLLTITVVILVAMSTTLVLLNSNYSSALNLRVLPKYADNGYFSIKDSHISSVFPKGTMLFIKPFEKYKQGDYIIVRNRDEAVKEYSFNDKYVLMQVNSDIDYDITGTIIFDGQKIDSTIEAQLAIGKVVNSVPFIGALHDNIVSPIGLLYFIIIPSIAVILCIIYVALSFKKPMLFKKPIGVANKIIANLLNNKAQDTTTNLQPLNIQKKADKTITQSINIKKVNKTQNATTPLSSLDIQKKADKTYDTDEFVPLDKLFNMKEVTETNDNKTFGDDDYK